MYRGRELHAVIFRRAFERSFATNLRPTLARDALIDRNAMQPRRDFRIAAKPTEIAEGGDEGLLRGVARVLFAPKNAVGQSEDATLPTAHNFAEGFVVARECSLHDLLVARRLHCLNRALGRRPRIQLQRARTNGSRTRSFRRSNAPHGRKYYAPSVLPQRR